MSGIQTQAVRSSRFTWPIWLTGPWGVLGLIAILYTFINLAWTFFHWGGPERVTLIANLFSFFPSLAAVITAWRVAGARELAAPLRRAWFLLGLSFLMFFLGSVIWAYLEVVLQIEPFPSIADVFYLAFYPIALWGLLSMPSASQNRRERFTLWLDLLCILTAAAMFVGYFIIMPTAAVSSPDLLTQLIAPAYPLGSLLVLGGMLTVLYRRPSTHTWSALGLLLVGIIFFLGGDFAFGYTSLTGSYGVGGWTDASWNVAQLFFALAALRKVCQCPDSSASQTWIAGLNRLAHWLPSIAVVLGFGLVSYVLIAKYSPAAEWLMGGALVLALLVVARQIVSPGFIDMPVRVKVILTCIMVSVLSVSLVTATAYLTIRSNLESVVGEGLKADVEIRSETLGNEMAQQLDLIEGFVLGETIENEVTAASANYAGDEAAIETVLQRRDLAWKAAGNSDPLVQNVLNNATAQELYEFIQNFPTYGNLLLTDQYGATLAATSRPENYYQGTHDWWQAAYNHGQGAVYIGPPTFYPASHDIRITIAMPVHVDHGKEVVGIIYADYHLHDILKFLTASPQVGTQSGFAVLLPTGKLITSQGNLQSLDPDTLTSLEASREADYAQLLFQGAVQLISQAQVTSPDPTDAALFRNLNWTLITYEEPSMAFAPLHTAWRTTLLTTLLVLLLTSGVAVILAQILMAPISRLTQAVAQIASGDPTTKAQVESRDEIGTLARTFNSMLDELARAHQDVQESEALYRSLVNFSPDMIVVQREGRVLFINPAGVDLLSATRAEEFVGQPLMERLHPGDQEQAAAELENLQGIRGPSPLLQRKMHRLDGTNFDAELRVIPISYAGGPAIQFVVRDITERKEAEEKIRHLLMEVGRQKGDLEVRVAQRTDELSALNLRLQAELTERQRLLQSLQESEQRFHQVFETSPDAIFLLDPHDPTGIWRIIDCNPSASQMNGYTREELIGQPIDILNVTKGNREDFVTSLEQLRKEVMLRGIEAQHRHKAGHAFPIEYSTSLLTLGDREMVLGIDRDITERKQVEETLRHTKEVAESASRAKSEFLSRMSHELRTPMNAILGFAQLLTLSQKEPLSPVQKERVKQILLGGEHLLDLINEILDISSIEAGRVQISPEPVALRESIQEALNLTAPLANQRNIQFQLHWSVAAEARPYVMADQQRLKQVLLNLLSNAVKYNRPGGFVIIQCEASGPDRAWRISITDTGPGMGPDDLSHLFVPFERLSAELSKVEGTGLGLALAKRLVELMQGQIGVESALGQGSTFWIELPATESQFERLQRAGGTGNLPSLPDITRTILYVEDNRANFELVQQVLADYEHIELLWAADPETSVALSHQRHPDLILLDLHLGGRDGTEVLKQLKASSQTAAIPVVVISADATPRQAEHLMALGAYSYLTKPLNVPLFIQLTDELLREQELEPC